ncbi:uncharacterized protein V1516DRAFT_380519 [Lipomyces oligophaga]|uniref:uncharacterized protein n=1 Tax=Lipomyces oligophaga TaxID=45792 RepID=UPI0034CEF067
MIAPRLSIMTLPSSFSGLTLVPISSVTPDSFDLSVSFLSGSISLFWPFSSARDDFSIRLADNDFRNRKHKGQIRLSFRGKSLGKQAESLLNTGDSLQISLSGFTLIPQSNINSDADADWILECTHGALLKINDDDPIMIQPSVNILSQTIAPATPLPPSVPSIIPTPELSLENSTIQRPLNSSPSQGLWSTPPETFRRRPRPATDDSISSGTFFDLDDSLAGPLPKRTKSEKSSDYVFTPSIEPQIPKSNPAESAPPPAPTPPAMDSAFDSVPATPLPAPSERERRQLESLGGGLSETDLRSVNSSIQFPVSTFPSLASSPTQPELQVPSIMAKSPGLDSTRLLHDENELYRTLMRSKSEAAAAEDEQDDDEIRTERTHERRSVKDDASVVTQSGSLYDPLDLPADNESDRHAERLENAQSTLYHEILQAKLLNPVKNVPLDSTAVTMAGESEPAGLDHSQHHVFNESGSDQEQGDVSSSEVKENGSAKNLDILNVQPGIHHVTLEDEDDTTNRPEFPGNDEIHADISENDDDLVRPSGHHEIISDMDASNFKPVNDESTTKDQIQAQSSTPIRQYNYSWPDVEEYRYGSDQEPSTIENTPLVEVLPSPNIGSMPMFANTRSNYFEEVQDDTIDDDQEMDYDEDDRPLVEMMSEATVSEAYLFGPLARQKPEYEIIVLPNDTIYITEETIAESSAGLYSAEFENIQSEITVPADQISYFEDTEISTTVQITPGNSSEAEHKNDSNEIRTEALDRENRNGAGSRSFAGAGKAV